MTPALPAVDAGWCQPADGRGDYEYVILADGQWLPDNSRRMVFRLLAALGPFILGPVEFRP